MAKKEIIDIFQKLEEQKKQLIILLGAIDSSSLNARPEPGKWSVAQVVYHHYLSELLTLKSIQKQANPSRLKKAGMKTHFQSLVLNIALALPIKYKAPHRVSENIPDPVNWEKLVQDWGKLRNSYQAFIENYPDDALNLQLFKHPRSGVLTLSQTMSFLYFHLKHHLPQIERLLSKIERSKERIN